MVLARTPTVTASVPTRAKGRFIGQATPCGVGSRLKLRRDPRTGSNLANRSFLVSNSPGHEHVVKRVERVLEEGLERVETPEAARAVVARIEKMSAGHTEAEAGEAAAHQTATAPDPAKAAADKIERAAAEPATPERAVADVLTTTAAQAVAPGA